MSCKNCGCPEALCAACGANLNEQNYEPYETGKVLRPATSYLDWCARDANLNEQEYVKEAIADSYIEGCRRDLAIEEELKTKG